MAGVLGRLKHQWKSKWAPPQLPEPLGCPAALCAARFAQCATTFEPRAQGALLDHVQGQGWALRLPPGQDGANFERHKSFGYLDFKFGLRGAAPDGPLVLEVTTTVPLDDEGGSPLVVCQPPCPWGRCKAGQVALSAPGAVEWFLDDARKPLEVPDEKSLPEWARQLSTPDVCVVVALGVAPGDHTLYVTVTAPPPAFVMISHFIWF